ncbi:hypothetical protein [Comamonas sp. 26]|uniref:hypothetical protein n=1 Tax=Comamonas sp. 26 TaxID=2035201 RepID=UPI00130426CD|nr:hypothetical protein [Comamonas sp. 26]
MKVFWVIKVVKTAQAIWVILVDEIYAKYWPVMASMLQKSAPKERFFVGAFDKDGS